MNSIQKRFIGKTFNRLTVLKFSEYKKDELLKSGRVKRTAYYLCQCSCGNTKIIKGKYLKNGHTKSCGCLLPEITKERNIRRRKVTSYFPQLYCSYKGKAKFKLLEFDLTIEEFKNITSSNCYYCGVEPLQLASKQNTYRERLARYKEEYYYNGIDRIDSNKGYIKDNIRPCCGICNKAKRDLSDTDFSIWLDRLSNYQFNLKVDK